MKHVNEKCAVCGGELVEKEVEKLLRGGNHMASVKVSAEVCLHCGERFYSPLTVEKFEKIEIELESGDVDHLQAVGRAFQVAASF